MVESLNESIKTLLSYGNFVPSPKFRENPHLLIQLRASSNFSFVSLLAVNLLRHIFVFSFHPKLLSNLPTYQQKRKHTEDTLTSVL